MGSLDALVKESVRQVVREEIRAALKEALGDVGRALAPRDDGYLSVEKAAEFAEVHADTIRGWVKAGRLPEHRAGRELRIRRDELHRFLDVAANDDRPTPEQEAATMLSRRRK